MFPLQAQVPVKERQPLIAQNIFERFKWLFFPPKSISRGGTFGRRKGGATQGICPPVKKPLTALVPATQISSTTSEIPMGATASDHPTFWFYIPYAARLGRQAEFVLIDENEADVFSTTFALKATPGIIGLQVPEKMQPLQVGKQYRWVLSVICDATNRSGDVTVDGWVQRITLNSSVQSQLRQSMLPSEQFALYAQNGVWYEALTTLANSRLTQPSDKVVKSWQDVLSSVGLTYLSTEPINLKPLDTQVLKQSEL